MTQFQRLLKRNHDVRIHYFHVESSDSSSDTLGASRSGRIVWSEMFSQTVTLNKLSRFCYDVIMSPIAEKIDSEIKKLPLNEQVALSRRLSERLVEQCSVPSAITFSDGDDLEQKCVDAMNSSATPMTENDWSELRADAEAHYEKSPSV